MQKINQLKEILFKQAETKNELSKELVDLNREGQGQLEYLNKLKMAYSDTAIVQNSISQKEANLIASDYML